MLVGVGGALIGTWNTRGASTLEPEADDGRYVSSPSNVIVTEYVPAGRPSGSRTSPR